MLTEKQLLPPIKLYENQTEGKPVNKDNRDILGFGNDEVDLEKESISNPVNQ
jgi:hypothetical protein